MNMKTVIAVSLLLLCNMVILVDAAEVAVFWGLLNVVTGKHWDGTVRQVSIAEGLRNWVSSFNVLGTSPLPPEFEVVCPVWYESKYRMPIHEVERLQRHVREYNTSSSEDMIEMLNEAAQFRYSKCELLSIVMNEKMASLLTEVSQLRSDLASSQKKSHDLQAALKPFEPLLPLLKWYTNNEHQLRKLATDWALEVLTAFFGDQRNFLEKWVTPSYSTLLFVFFHASISSYAHLWKDVSPKTHRVPLPFWTYVAATPARSFISKALSSVTSRIESAVPFLPVETYREWYWNQYVFAALTIVILSWTDLRSFLSAPLDNCRSIAQRLVASIAPPATENTTVIVDTSEPITAPTTSLGTETSSSPERQRRGPAPPSPDASVVAPVGLAKVQSLSVKGKRSVTFNDAQPGQDGEDNNEEGEDDTDDEEGGDGKSQKGKYTYDGPIDVRAFMKRARQSSVVS